jgi:hypothetical protein
VAFFARLSAVTMAALAASVVAVPRLLAQAPSSTSHPSLAGIWAPTVPEDSDRLFGVGLTLIPGQGRLTIEQRANRLTVTITIPDDKLDPRLAIQGRFYPTVIYFVSEARSLGYGAGGPPKLTQATWVDDRLVIPNPWPGLTHPTMQTYSLDGDRLRVETRVEMGAGRENVITERLAKVK